MCFKEQRHPFSLSELCAPILVKGYYLCIHVLKLLKPYEKLHQLVKTLLQTSPLYSLQTQHYRYKLHLHGKLQYDAIKPNPASSGIRRNTAQYTALCHSIPVLCQLFLHYTKGYQFWVSSFTAPLTFLFLPLPVPPSSHCLLWPSPFHYNHIILLPLPHGLPSMVLFSFILSTLPCCCDVYFCATDLPTRC